MAERQISFSEASAVSYEEYLGALDIMADALPEVAMRYGELYRKGLELIRGYQLLPSFFDSKGRSCLLVGLAGYGEAFADGIPDYTEGVAAAWAQHHQAIVSEDMDFVENTISIIGRHHSAALHSARREIDQVYSDLDSDMPPTKVREILNGYTDEGRTAAIKDFIAAHDLFADQRAQLDKTNGEEAPCTVRVIGLRNDRDSDQEGRTAMLQAIGLKKFKRLPDGWLVSRSGREICITEKVADEILAHPAGVPFITNDGITTLRHEKAHLERDWRLDGSDIGSALNEIGAEVLSGALPADWHYKNLLPLLETYNNSIKPLPEDAYDGPGNNSAIDHPPTYLEELFLNTPPDADGFVYVLTGIARQVGLTGMVQMAMHLSPGAQAHLTDYYHISVGRHLGKPNAPNYFLVPVGDTYTGQAARSSTDKNPASTIGAVITSLQESVAHTDTIRMHVLEGVGSLLQALTTMQAYAADSSIGQEHFHDAVEAYNHGRSAAHHLGKTILELQDYIRDIA